MNSGSANHAKKSRCWVLQIFPLSGSGKRKSKFWPDPADPYTAAEENLR